MKKNELSFRKDIQKSTKFILLFASAATNIAESYYLYNHWARCGPYISLSFRAERLI